MKKVLKYFLYVYFSPTGRINRAGWWLIWLPFLLIGFLTPLGNRTFTAFLSILWINSLILVSVKRFHDTNRSGWRVLLWLVPVYGWFYVPIVCGFFKGTDGENKYGAPSSLIN